MDFLPQLASRNNVFLEKAKKHAKRLLKLAKNNNNQLNINNLSQAQDVLAQLNGYENWHAMIESINTKLTAERSKPYQHHIINDQTFVTLSEDNNSLEYSSKFPYLTQKEFMYSFLSLELNPHYSEKNSISSDDVHSAIYRLISYMKNEKHNSQFFLLFENKPLNTDLYSWQQQIDLATHCGLSLKDASLLFETEYPTNIKTALSVVIVIKTPLTQKNLHNKLITNVVNMYGLEFIVNVKHNIEQEFLNIITKQKTEKYPSIYNYSHNSWIKNIFTKPRIENTKILDFTTRISNGVSQWAGFLNLENLQLSIYHDKNNTDIFDNIYSIVNAQNYYNNDTINMNIAVNNIGIPFINSDTNRVHCYQPKIDFNPSVFIGNNELRNTLNNYIQYSNILNKFKQDNVIPHGFVIHNGSNNGLYHLLMKTFKNNNENIVSNKININNDFINILDLPLGCSISDDYDLTISQLIKICFNLKNISDFKYPEQCQENIYQFTHKLTHDLYTLNYNQPKQYTNTIESIHNYLPSELTKESWFGLCHYFIKQNKYYEAQICHNQAMPILSDLLTFLNQNKSNYQNDFPQFDIQNIISNIEVFINGNPQYNKPTNIYFDNNKLYFLDMNYINSHIMLFSCLIKTIFNHHKVQYLFSEKINSLLLNISDFDLSDSNDIEPLIFTIRESRKRYINTYLNTEFICYDLANFFQTQIITSELSEEQKQLVNLQTTDNKILDYNEFIINSHDYYNNYGINNPNGKYKLVISEQLYDVLSDNIANNI